MSEPVVVLNDGRSMPSLGFGTWTISDREAEEVVRKAIQTGYRLIDTAAAYGNEDGVGRAIAACGIPRDDLFVTTKVWNDSHGFDRTLSAFDESLGRLGLDVVDLYLIHWPVPSQGRFVETWKALIRLRDEGRAQSIGVCNFQPEHLHRLLDETGVTPSVNQIELHPFFQQTELRSIHRDRGIVTEAWSPLAKARFLDHPVLVEIARKHGKTPAQIVLRWHLENEIVAIPKTVHEERMKENFSIFDFSLDPEDRRGLEALDRPHRISNDPYTFGS